MGGWVGRSGHVDGNTKKLKNPSNLMTITPPHTGTQSPAHVTNRFSAYFVPQPAANNTYMHDPQFTLALKVKSESEGFAGVIG